MAELVETEAGANTGRLVQSAVVVNQLPNLLKQLGVLGAIAAAVALGAWVVLWSQTPNYSLLYGSLSDRDLTELMEALQAGDIDYRVDHASGAILVPSASVHDARLKLAAAGLPKSASMGFEVMSEQSGFGTSQFMETMRYQAALEAELARTVARVSNVRSARVHLALPKQSAFLRDRKPPSASVFIDLYPGRSLEKGQVQAISHLVAASVPNLPQSAVTVVDQKGSLLSDPNDDSPLALTERQLDYTRNIEERHRRAITDLLEQIAGPGAVHVQVSAEMDFTRSEETSETFNPDPGSVRSEQVLEEKRVGANATGIPGALSNQPPTPAAAPEAAAGATLSDAEANSTETAKTPESSRSQQTRNFEVDRTIAHVQTPVGRVRRLSVAVLVNKRIKKDDQGAVTSEDWTEDEVKRFTALAREAIGFSEARGDTISVNTADLIGPPVLEPLPEPPLWEQPWFWDLLRQLAGASFALMVLFGVVRPAVKSLTGTKLDAATALATAGLAADVAGQQGGMTILRLPDGRSITVDLRNFNNDTVLLPSPTSINLDNAADTNREAAAAGGPATEELTPEERTELELDLERVRKIVFEDPKLSALVIRSWLEAE